LHPRGRHYCATAFTIRNGLSIEILIKVIWNLKFDRKRFPPLGGRLYWVTAFANRNRLWVWNFGLDDMEDRIM
ncbi:MAG: hypothetical protein IKD31_04405, partial [Clostridia bacterium]|nr:hypothetical protein [Clostridia bacterium]